MMKSLSSGSAPGEDNMRNSDIKHPLNSGLNSACRALVDLITLMMILPMHWKYGRAIPIHKLGKDASLWSSWRPIMLLLIVLKLVERLMAMRMLKYIRRHNLIPGNMYAYLPDTRQAPLDFSSQLSTHTRRLLPLPHQQMLCSWASYKRLETYNGRQSQRALDSTRKSFS